MQIVSESVFSSVLGASLSGIADLDLIEVNGQWRLYTACATDYSLAAFSLNAAGDPTLIDTQGYSANSGTFGLTGLSLYQANGTVLLMPLARYDDRAVVYQLDAVGRFGTPTTPLTPEGNPVPPMDQVVALASFQLFDKSFIYYSTQGDPHLRTYRVTDDLDYAHKRLFVDSDKTYLTDVTQLYTVEAINRNFLFAVSGLESGISCYLVSKVGIPANTHNIGAEDGFGFAGQLVLGSVEQSNKLMLVVGGAQSSSLSVFSVNKKGVMRFEDQVHDTQETRFANVSALSVIDVDGRGIVIAGGSDDGLTLFEILPNLGSLRLIDVIEDTAGRSLANVSDIEAYARDGQLHIFAASALEDGVTHLTLDVSALGPPIVGTGAHETLVGTAQDDLIIGMNGADTLYGGDGDDVLVDGIGADFLVGGAGADVFRFVVDRQVDTIVDFMPGLDKIDLSEIPMLYSFDQLVLKQRDDFVAVQYKGGGIIKVMSHDDFGDMEVDDLDAGDFIFS